MISFNRGPEPASLSEARRKKRPVASAALALHGDGSEEFRRSLGGYQTTGVKKTLYDAQRKKCAWCERRTDYSSNPIEHYRPKKGAWRHLRGDETTLEDPLHYWWLTWSWDNLLFSCVRCNDRGHKANYFPLLGTACEPWRGRGCEPSLALEHPSLLDPSRGGFLDHVRWRASGRRLPRQLWQWTPVALTDPGEATIQVLKLDELADDVQSHLNVAVLPSIEEIEQHLKAERFDDARRRWGRVCELLDPRESLTCATWCALEQWMPAAKRTRFGFREPPRPP